VQLVQLRRRRRGRNLPLKYSPNLRIVRVMCSGRVSPELVVRTFREGADGVMVLG
jgi:F420-non-reducing hydrogenase iron-sulfur subunit